MSSKSSDTEAQSARDVPHPEVAWWLKYSIKAVGTVAGALAMSSGIWTCFSFKVSCLVSGIILFLFGFIVIVFEMPCCCSFLDFVEKIGQFGDRRPYWQKASIYMIFGMVPAMLCFGLTVLPGAGGIFVTGVLYGMIALGRKTDRETMQQRAAGSSKDEIKLGLVEKDANQKTYTSSQK